LLLKKPDKLKISVVIPTHNRQEELKRALKSLFEQTVLPDEVIVVDDASQPAVNDDIFNDAPGSVSTKLLRHALPEGAASARNNGIKNASGDWIAFLDDDDEFFPNKLECIIDFIKANKEADVIYHPAEIHLVNEKVKYFSRPGLLNNKRENFRKLFIRNEVGGTSMVIARKESIANVGFFTESLPAIEDHELWLKMASAGLEFCRVNIPLTHYYYNTQKKSLTKSLEKRDLALGYIEARYSEEFSTFDNKSKCLYKERKIREKVFISLLNLQLSAAFRFQLELIRISLNPKDVLFLLLIPFGTRTVFKMRSLK
jgi:glycosyltransferase involved in cell wall biosynthesis